MIEIFYETQLPVNLDTEKIELFTRRVSQFLSIKAMYFSLSFVDRERIRMLNYHFRDKDYPTDVLTFCLNDSPEEVFPNFDHDESEQSLGDIIICTDIVAQNAKEFNVTFEEELRRVIIHGILHLLGKNHATNESNEPMLKEQEYIMEELKGLTLTKS